MSSLQLFVFEGHDVRVAGSAFSPWWVASDVCKVLEQPNTSQVLERLDEDEKGIQIVDTLGGQQNMLCINESGLYSLILTSRKPQARQFKKWITSEVIPSIRRTGGYSSGASYVPTPGLEPDWDFLNFRETVKAAGEDFIAVLNQYKTWHEVGRPKALKKRLQKKLAPAIVVDTDAEEAFMQESYPNGSTDLVKASVLYEQYKQWCEDNGHRPKSQTRFSPIIQQLGCKKSPKTGGCFYYEVPPITKAA